MFVWLFAVLFPIFTSVKLSMNHEFGSPRRRLAIRATVLFATIMAIIAHNFVAWFFIGIALAFQPLDQQLSIQASFLANLAIIVSGTLIWGFLVPKAAYSILGTKPPQIAESPNFQHNAGVTVPPRAHGYAQRPRSTQHRPPADATQDRPWEQNPKRKPKNAVLEGAIILTLLASGGIALLVVSLTDDESTKQQPRH